MTRPCFPVGDRARLARLTLLALLGPCGCSSSTDVWVTVTAGAGVQASSLWAQLFADGPANTDAGSRSTAVAALDPTFPATWDVRTDDAAIMVRAVVTARTSSGDVLVSEASVTTKPHERVDLTLDLELDQPPPMNTDFSAVPSGTPEDLHAVWGNTDAIYAVGANGVILRSTDPQQPFQPMTSNTSQNLVTVGGYGSLVVAAGGNLALGLVSQGTTWERQLFPSTFYMVTAVAGTPSNGVYLIDRYMPTLTALWTAPDGLAWNNQAGLGLPALNGLADAGGTFFAVGDGGVILSSNVITTWTPESSGVTTALNAVWGPDPSDAYAVGAGGTILRRSASGWSAIDSGVHTALYGVWGSSVSDVYVVGAMGTILHTTDGIHFVPSLAPNADLYGVWGNGRGDVFVVGAGGTLLHHGE
jgi:hypothetical protein